MTKYIKSKHILMFNDFMKLKLHDKHCLNNPCDYNRFINDINPLFKDLSPIVKREIKHNTHFELCFGKWNITKLINKYGIQEIEYDDVYDSGYAIVSKTMSEFYANKNKLLTKEKDQIVIYSNIKDDSYKNYKRCIEILSKELK